MAFTLLRAASRLTYMGLVERNSGIAAMNLFNEHKQPSFYVQSHPGLMKFSTTTPLRDSKKNFVKQARKYSNKRAETTEKREYDSDSDSDDERAAPKVVKRGETEFWRRKMRTLHGLLDLNKDGVISFEDFMILADKFGELDHLNPDEIEEFKTIMKSTWEAQWGELSPYNLVTVEQFMKDMHHVINDGHLHRRSDDFLPFIFKAINHDHTGQVSLHDYKIFFNCLGLTDEDAAVSFAIIDVNNDGKLSLEEFLELGHDYFYNEDEKCPSRMFWGPLIKDH